MSLHIYYNSAFRILVDYFTIKSNWGQLFSQHGALWQQIFCTWYTSGAFYYIRSRDFFTRVVVRAKAKVKMAWWTRNKHCNFYDGFLLNAWRDFVHILRIHPYNSAGHSTQWWSVQPFYQVSYSTFYRKWRKFRQNKHRSVEFCHILNIHMWQNSKNGFLYRSFQCTF